MGHGKPATGGWGWKSKTIRFSGNGSRYSVDGLEYIVFATVSDGTPGLFRLYQATGDKRYAEVPTHAAVGCWRTCATPVPRFYDCVDPTTGMVMKDRSPFWPEKEKQTILMLPAPTMKDRCSRTCICTRVTSAIGQCSSNSVKACFRIRIAWSVDAVHAEQCSDNSFHPL
jgi:hypothetical protein